MYNFKNLLVTIKEDGITHISINRPKVLNALDTLTLQELKSCIDQLRTDARVKAVILQGAGEKAFVAGSDLTAMSQMTAHEAMAFSRFGHEVFNAIENLPPWLWSVQSMAIAWVAAWVWPWPVISATLPLRPNSDSQK